MASDAFFPFPDSIILAYKAGVKSIIQPGGSLKDDLVIKEVDEKSCLWYFHLKDHSVTSIFYILVFLNNIKPTIRKINIDAIPAR